MPITKTPLNNTQVELAKQWLPSGSQPYGYDSNKGLLWYWQPHYSGVAIKNALKLSAKQLQELNQLL